jgi:hypothetical protein
VVLVDHIEVFLHQDPVGLKGQADERRVTFIEL